MVGRKARPFTLQPDDRARLEKLVRQGKTEQRVARRARLLLDMDRGIAVGKLAEMVGMDPASVWRVCRRYEARGIDAIFDAQRSGRRPNAYTDNLGRSSESRSKA